MSSTGEVLVIERDASIRSLIEAVVRMIPRRPVGAGDGRSALALLASRRFDAIVLDLLLPELSGSDVLEYVSEHAPELLPRIIVVTTAPESRWSRLELTRACAAVLRKPFSLEELRTVLADCCSEGG